MIAWLTLLAVALSTTFSGCGYQKRDVSKFLGEAALRLDAESVALGDTFTATLTLTDLGKRPMPGESIDFATDGVVLSSIGAADTVTDANGQASIQLSASRAGSGSIAAFWQRTKTSRLALATQTVVVSVPEESLTFVAGDSMTAGDRLTLQGAVARLDGQPVVNESVTLTATDANLQLTATGCVTDAQGAFAVSATSTRTGTYVVAAATTRASAQLTLRVAPSVPSDRTSQLTASPTTLTADGHSVSQITLTLTDQYENLIPSAAVTFSARETGGALSGTLVVTDAAGYATTELRAIMPGTLHVQASSGPLSLETPLSLSMPASCTGRTVRYSNPPSIVTGNFPVAVAQADFNEDGTIDVVVANQNDNTLGVALGVGNGLYAAQTTYATGAQPAALAVDDFNQDGHQDVAVLSNSNATFRLFTGGGDGTLRVSVANSTASPLAMAAGTLNADVYPDVAIIGSGGVVYWYGDSHGTFTASAVGGAPTTVSAMALGDLNGDGLSDVVTVSAAAAGYTVILTTSVGPTGSNITYGTDSNAHVAVTLADLNGDGVFDMALLPAAKTGGAWFETAFGTGQGTFTNIQTHPTTSVGSALAAADMNRDGIEDIVYAAPDQIGVALALDTNGTYATAPYAGVASPGGLTLADVDGDAWVDALVVAPNGNTISVVTNAGAGTLHQPNVYAAYGAGNLGSVVADFNQDGNADVAVVTYYGEAFSTLLGNGDGTMRAGGVTPLNVPARQVVPGNLNTDHYPDLLVVTDKQIFSALGSGDGNFTLMQNANMQNVNAVYAQMGNLNNDSYPDYVAVTFAYGTMVTGFGQAGGVFAAPKIYSTPIAPGSVAVHDFNGDGMLDAVLSSALSNNYVLYAGTTGGNMLLASTSTTAFSQSMVKTQDLNGDGLWDLVFVNNGVPSTCSVVLGKSTGVFSKETVYPTNGVSTNNATIVDVDADGKADLLFDADGSFSVLPGNGDGTFEAARLYMTNPHAQSIAVADMDHNGLLDVIISSIGTWTGVNANLLDIHLAQGCPD